MAILRCAPQQESDVANQTGGTKTDLFIGIFWLFAMGIEA